MSYYKIIGIALLGLVISSVMKRMKEEYAHFSSLIVGIYLTVTALTLIKPVTEYLDTLGKASGLSSLFTVMFKSCGISVITSVASDLCRDMGEGSRASKLEMCGKGLILSLSLPLLISVFDSVISILG